MRLDGLGPSKVSDHWFMPSFKRSIIDSESNKRREGLTWFCADRWFSKLQPALCDSQKRRDSTGPKSPHGSVSDRHRSKNSFDFLGLKNG